MFAYVNWNALLAEVKRLSSDSTCTYREPYHVGGRHVGGRHIIRRLEFPGGGEPWLVRVPIIPASPLFNGEE